MPVSAVAAAVAYMLASSVPAFSAVGAVSATCMGLSASWYFVGLSKPFIMFAVDTLPRAAGTAAGVLLMEDGYSAIFGPIGMFCGIVAGLSLSTVWIIWETRRAGALASKRPSLGSILVANRHGITSALGSASYTAAPLAIVSLVAPGIQPAFALADRVKGLIFVASAPAATVLQGWVPRATGQSRVKRANVALLTAAIFAFVLGVGTMLIAPSLVSWLGNGQISVSKEVMALMSACVAIILFQLVLERTALASFGRLRIITKAIGAGSIVGLPLVGLGAYRIGTAGALAGVLIGLTVTVTIELSAYLNKARNASIPTLSKEGVRTWEAT